jgi:hypothetical protein
MKRILLASTALLFATPALADPGTWDGSGPQAVRYPVVTSNGIFTEHLGDGSTPAGGVAPYYTNGMPANIPSLTTADELSTSATTTGPDEFKFRFTLYSHHALAEDTLAFHCQRNSTHPHEFMGAVDAGGCSTYAQLRNAGIARKTAGKLPSTNPGPTINLASYWHMGLIDCGATIGPLGTGTVPGALGDGICRFKKDLLVPLYYEPAMASFTLANAAHFSPIPLGLGEVFGHHNSDPWQLKERADIAAANAANIAAGGTAVYQDPDPMAVGNFGFYGWSCSSPGGTPRSAGTQASIDDLDCSAGDTLILELHSQGCWDGHNGNSPDGRSHVSYAITAVATNGTNQYVCPYDGYKLPELIDKPQWILHTAISSSVPNDSPFGSSDAAFQAKARADAGKCVTATAWGSSATVCAPAGAATFVCKPGCGAHADYLAAWHGTYFWRAFNKCDAIPIPAALTFSWIWPDRTPAGTGCNSNTIDTTTGATANLLNSPLLTIPTATDVDGDRIQEYYPMPVPKGHMGGMTMPHQ